MKPYLLDANVLIALAWPNHIHHAKIHEWFAIKSRNGWATCPLTECAFVRFSSNPKIIADAVTPHEAVELLKRLTGLPRHVFWPDHFPLAALQHVPTHMLGGHNQVNDAYLLSLAIQSGGRLATMDKGITSLLPTNDKNQNAIELIS